MVPPQPPKHPKLTYLPLASYTHLLPLFLPPISQSTNFHSSTRISGSSLDRASEPRSQPYLAERPQGFLFWPCSSYTDFPKARIGTGFQTYHSRVKPASKQKKTGDLSLLGWQIYHIRGPEVLAISLKRKFLFPVLQPFQPVMREQTECSSSKGKKAFFTTFTTKGVSHQLGMS